MAYSMRHARRGVKERQRVFSSTNCGVMPSLMVSLSPLVWHSGMLWNTISPRTLTMENGKRVQNHGLHAIVANAPPVRRAVRLGQTWKKNAALTAAMTLVESPGGCASRRGRPCEAWTAHKAVRATDTGVLICPSRRIAVADAHAPGESLKVSPPYSGWRRQLGERIRNRLFERKANPETTA